MTTSSKIVLGIAMALVFVTLTALALLAALTPVTRVTKGQRPATPVTIPIASQTLSDGSWFGWVRVDEAATGVELVIDPAAMLTGAEAHTAAVAAGVIAPHEDLPNDFFIDNPDDQVFTNLVTTDATVIVRSSVDPAEQIYLTPNDLHQLFSGTYEGHLIYGIIPGQSIPMTVTIAGGMVTAANQVYLP